MSYTCTTSKSNGGPIRYYYTVEPSVAAVLADRSTVTPSGFTSLATVISRSFATASLPVATPSRSALTSTGSSSVSEIQSGTAATTTPSSIHGPKAGLGTPAIVGICIALLIILMLLAFVAWYYLRRRGARGPGSCNPSSPTATPKPHHGLGSATSPPTGLKQPSESPTAYPWSPLSVEPDDSAFQTCRPNAARRDMKGPVAPIEAGVENHEGRPGSTRRRSGNGVSQSQDVPSSVTQPSCTQPSF